MEILSENSIDYFIRCSDDSWVASLIPDPDTAKYAPNKKSREVKSGHFVLVKPSPIPAPRLIAVSDELAKELGLNVEDAWNDPRFVEFFSGHIEAFKKLNGASWNSWATPYALAIYGQDYYDNCPFGTGNGYGDGRAISVGEFVVGKDQKRWEFQLKGGGTTPFCRSADGRAVLRSSVREFLVSEAMHHLGVSTTRAISLIVSDEEKVARPWYSKNSCSRNPDVMVKNHAAITTRVAPSFMRVGHLQLFERRVRKNQDKANVKVIQELFLIINHAIFREYPEVFEQEPKEFISESSSVSDLKRFLAFQGKNYENCVEKSDMWNLAKDCSSQLSAAYHQNCILNFLQKASTRFAELMAGWISVGFCQGNFNSDNCLVGGRTMDYGPFGFMEKFVPMWCMWIGGAPHFGFMNQPQAAHKNFTSLAKATLPLMDQAGAAQVYNIITKNYETILDTLNEKWMKKLGLSDFGSEEALLVNNLLSILERSSCDWTIFWRELAGFVPRVGEANAAAEFVKILEGKAFYYPLVEATRERFLEWFTNWSAALTRQNCELVQISEWMKQQSPKYVPREWMLVNAYENAIQGDNGPLLELYQLFKRPYDEQSAEMEAKYYKMAPVEIYQSNTGDGGGVQFMS